MYNGTLSLVDATELNILKQQVELINAINSGLKDFVGLESNISAFLKLLKTGVSGAGGRRSRLTRSGVPRDATDGRS